jgi:hypothetical protein
MFGLALVAAVASMALVAASSAMATTTQLCYAHEQPCSANNTVFFGRLVAKDPVFLTVSGNLLCAEALILFEAKKLGQPQSLPVVNILWFECELGATKCTVTTTEAQFLLLRTALNLGTALSSGNLFALACGGPPCTYGTEFTLSAEGALHTAGAGNGMFTASETPIGRTAGGLFCAKEVKLDALFEFLSATYIVS